jgi:hypothetical protein
VPTQRGNFTASVFETEVEREMCRKLHFSVTDAHKLRMVWNRDKSYEMLLSKMILKCLQSVMFSNDHPRITKITSTDMSCFCMVTHANTYQNQCCCSQVFSVSFLYHLPGLSALTAVFHYFLIRLVFCLKYITFLAAP